MASDCWHLSQGIKIITHRYAKYQGNGLRAKQRDISGHAVKGDNGHVSGRTQGLWSLLGVASIYKVQEREMFDC